MNKSKSISKVLLRNYIYDRLYYPNQGYFCKPDLQVGQLKQSLKFNQFIGYQDYQKALSDNYPKNAWLTPSQIFKPYYGMTVANYILQAHQKYQKKIGHKMDLHIIQVGAGLGSAARSILYYFKNYENKTYQNLTYTIVQISKQLCNRMQKSLLKQNERHFKSGKINIVNENIINFKKSGHNYVLFFQVLDNLPHDRVVMSQKSDKFDLETRVCLENNQQQLVQISDLTIKKALEYYYKTPQKNKINPNLLDRIAQKIVNKFYKQKTKHKQILFLPTYFLKFLNNLQSHIPNAHLIISDFDALNSKIPGLSSPIVSKKGQLSHQKQDYNTYLVNRGEADIFFPTDFELIKIMYEEVTKKKGLHIKSHEFIKQFSRENWAETKSGFNPFKEDFLNTSFFLSSI